MIFLPRRLACKDILLSFTFSAKNVIKALSAPAPQLWRSSGHNKRILLHSITPLPERSQRVERIAHWNDRGKLKPSHHPSIHAFIHSSIHLSIHPSTHPFTYSSNHPSNHPSFHPLWSCVPNWTNVCMEGWMDGWMNWYMDKWMNDWWMDG